MGSQRKTTSWIRYATCWVFILSFMLVGCATTQPTNNTTMSKSDLQKEREIGERQFALKNYPSALIHLLKAEQLDPTDPVTHYDLALVYLGKELPGKAILHLKEAIRLKPDYPDAYNALGFVYLNIKQYDKAIFYLQKAATDIYYKTPYLAYYNLGQVYQNLKQYKKAIENYKHAIRISPRYARAYFRLGEIEELFGHVTQARLYYEKALLSNPHNPQAFYNLGRIYMTIGEYRKAAQAFHKVIDLAPATILSDKAARHLKQLKGYDVR